MKLGAMAVWVAAVGLVGASAIVARTSASIANATAARGEALAVTEAPVEKGEGIVTIASHHSVDETVEKLKGILQAKGVMVFAVIDHSGEAAKVGMTMPPTKVVIFGSPKAGTPLMLASPSVAIDLPLKILVAQDAQGKVWVSYNSPDYLAQRHGLPKDLLPNIAVVSVLAEKAAE
jgi:uncharacterized protein (DUF302 family)